MKFFYTLFIVLCATWAKAQSPALNNQPFDVQHYSFELELNDATDNIKGETTIRILTVRDTRQFDFNLVKREAEGKGMTVEQVFINQEKATFIHNASGISISSEQTIPAGQILEVQIQYQGIPADGLIISKNKFGERTFFADNWPNRAQNWLPCVDHPADKASVDFRITAPSHYQVIANGVMMERTDLREGKSFTHYREEVPLPTKVMVIGLARFSVQNIGETHCIPISSWVYAANREKGQTAYMPAREALDFFIKNVGPYPYRKLANVQSKTIFGGLENANAIFYFENSVSGQNESLVVHEVAHQWFGNHATETDFSHVWLSEGFASYFTHLFIENKYGADSLQQRMKKDREEILQYYATGNRKPIVDTTKNYMELLNPNSYQKGSWVLHMLRNTVGDSIFWKGIRTYYSEFAGRNASSSDFKKVMENISGKDLQQFFHQWLELPGQPEINLDWKYSNGNLSLTIEQLQTEKFVSPIEIGIRTKEGLLIKSINMASGRSNFNLPLEEKPLSVRLDPNTRLLFKPVR